MRARRLMQGVGLLALVAVAGVGVYLLARRDEPTGVQAASTDPHGEVGRISASRLARILEAGQTATADTSQAALVAEGRRLFRSTEVAKSGESCQGCHTEGGGTNSDVGVIVHPQETGDFKGPREPPPLWNIADTAPYGWTGHEPDLTAFAVSTIVSHFRDGTGQPEAKTGEQARALAAYMRTLRPPETAFDQGRMSASALRGEALFVGKGGCSGCHIGPTFTDGALHDLRVPQAAGDDDTGAATSGPLLHAFNTAQLRDVASTAPYMHNGSLATLRDVVRFYNEQSVIAPLGLTDPEIDDLVAYLESL
jgi:cytochrome c peroxidase